ncbi:MAG: hypothetical protein MZV70_30180 [Desulfobacterales bacterium]|nr:hypothetical protein [Desulfobacterales bacterium]
MTYGADILQAPSAGRIRSPRARLPPGGRLLRRAVLRHARQCEAEVDPVRSRPGLVQPGRESRSSSRP